MFKTTKYSVLVASLGLVALKIVNIGNALPQQTRETKIEAPRFWNDRELLDWATPVVGVNVRPGHYSEKEYYAAPELELVRTYPVYAPGREPAGYWHMLQNAKPERLLTPGARTEAEWVEAGKRVFHELDAWFFRSYDPKLIEMFRSPDEFQKRGGHALKDGTVFGMRWAPTSKGLALSITDCAGSQPYHAGWKHPGWRSSKCSRRWCCCRGVRAGTAH